MGITSHWQPSDVQYIETVKYMAKRKYHQALNHLQKLVIQHLFELNKLNLAGTGYRMRKHIAKSTSRKVYDLQVWGTKTWFQDHHVSHEANSHSHIPKKIVNILKGYEIAIAKFQEIS